MKMCEIYLDSKGVGKQLKALKKGDGHQIYLDSKEMTGFSFQEQKLVKLHNEPPPAGVRSTQCLGVEYSEISYCLGNVRILLDFWEPHRNDQEFC